MSFPDSKPYYRLAEREEQPGMLPLDFDSLGDEYVLGYLGETV